MRNNNTPCKSHTRSAGKILKKELTQSFPFIGSKLSPWLGKRLGQLYGASSQQLGSEPGSLNFVQGCFHHTVRLISSFYYRPYGNRKKREKEKRKPYAIRNPRSCLETLPSSLPPYLPFFHPSTVAGHPCCVAQPPSWCQGENRCSISVCGGWNKGWMMPGKALMEITMYREV